MKTAACLIIGCAALTTCGAAIAGTPTNHVVAAPSQVARSEPLAAEASYVLRTDDTTLALSVNADQKLLIRELSGPDGWNWTTDPSVFPLLERVDVAGAQASPVWTHRSSDLTKDNGDGVTLTMVFTCADPALELKLDWQARRGPGPVHLAMFITNKSNEIVTIYEQESLDVCISGPGKDTSVWSIRDDGALPDATGVYRDLLAENYRKELGVSEGEDYIPLAVVDAGGMHGVYFGWEWSIGRIEISAHHAAGRRTCQGGQRRCFQDRSYPRRKVRGAPRIPRCLQGGP